MQYRIDSHHDITPTDLAAVYREAILVDLRAGDEYDAGHIPGAQRVTIDAIDAGWTGTDGRLPYVTICRTGEIARRAADVLRRHGRDAVALHGGILAWSAAGLPLVTNTHTPPHIE